LEQATGIEPAARPWEGRVLPLYDACNFSILSFLRLKIKKTLDHFLNRPYSDHLKKRIHFCVRMYL
jgi:hypothetical protein